ncbi:hypothetical protein ACFSO7_16375 [Bacillus sp. CGMCC 1.16607]|uniref:YkoP family protein n=1 Tax=Bacillus sp. CGMCC 1.16607 TaxID=3351842 RepID=UPI003624E340
MIRGIFLFIWNVFDPFYFSLTRLKRNGVFRVRLTRYKGKDVLLSDGMMICKNDLLLKIHLHNVKLLREFSNKKNELAKGRGVYRRVLESMPLLAEYIFNHPKEADIKGIIGITLINKGFRPLGFDCVKPNNKLYSIYKKISHIPIFLLSNPKFSFDNLKKHQSVYLMMSKKSLVKRYNHLS